MVHRGISRVKAKVNFTPPTQATNSVEATADTAQPKGTKMPFWLLAIFQLIPVIANGVHAVKTDVTLKQKQNIASDLLKTAIAGATVAVPPQDQELSAAASELAQGVLASTVANLHATGTPATPPAAPDAPTAGPAATA